VQNDEIDGHGLLIRGLGDNIKGLVSEMNYRNKHYREKHKKN
jgi:hypothetical protein